MTQRITLPLFGERDEIKPFHLRQLVSAIELRFQSLESNSAGFFENLQQGDLDSRYSQIGHGHTSADITGIVSSIFDLIDVTGTPTIGQSIVWDGNQFIPSSISGGGVVNLNDLTDVNAASPTDGYVLTWESATLRWKAKPSSASGSTLFGLTDTSIAGQSSGDLLFNSGSNIWSNTGALFKWVPGVGVQLGNNINISWANSIGASVGLLSLNSIDEFEIGDQGYGTVISGLTTTINSDQTTITSPRIDFGNPSGNVDYNVFLRSGANDDARMYFGETDDYYGGSIGIDATGNNFELRTHNLNSTGAVVMYAPYTSNQATFPNAIRMVERTAAPSDAAGHGQLWVKDDAPNTLIFTDDTGVDRSALNATHTGEVTGATTLTLDVTAITNKTDVVADSVDAVPIYDNTDGGIKRTALNSITDGGYF